MALTKDFASGTKFYYARVHIASFSKQQPVQLMVDMRVRDTEDEDYDVSEQMLQYCPDTGAAPWTIANLSLVDKNCIQAGYTWLKDNVELFNGWSDS